MKHSMLNIIKNASKTDNFEAIQSIFNLYEQLQYSKSLKQLCNDLFEWLQKSYNITNVTISLFDTKEQNKENIFVKGEEFYLDDSLCLFFIINTHTNENAIVSFCASSQEHYEQLNEQYEQIEAAFLLISPIIESRILRKNFIESQSIDSVTNVYNRQYLTQHVNKMLTLSQKQCDKIFILMISVDRLKAVIDEFDYDTGDRVLIRLAKVIHANIEQYDMVARVTGDDFLVAMTSCKEQYCVETIVKKIILDFSKVDIPVNNNNTLKKTICIGYDWLETNSNKTIDDAIKNADNALYEAKNQGRSSFKSFVDLTEEDSLELF